jgi:hypothetical protein
MAAMIGIRGAKAIYATKAKSSSTYSRAYAMYAVMMTCSGLAHCVVPSSTSAVFNFWVTFLDMTLTSSIAFHFGLAALADLGFDEEGKPMKALMSLGEIAIFSLWLWFGFIHPTSKAFWYLYVGLIVICCGAYVLVQGVLLIFNGFRGFAWFAAGAAAGGVGLWCALNRGFLCSKFGANFGGSFWWDALSNIAMLALAGYYLTSRDMPNPPPSEEQQADEDGLFVEDLENPELPSYHDLPHNNPPAYSAHPQIVYIPLQMYPTPRED